MSRAFKFRSRTVRFPWSNEAAEFFELDAGDIGPESYTVTFHLKTVMFEVKCKSAGGWTRTYRRRVRNYFNLSVGRGK